ncbi:MAG: M23 family metallopeptidase [Nitrospinae bacterium]|nr:M23 family metallopeptidase [Nitrospinota bacterium]
MYIPPSSLQDQNIQKKNKFRLGFIFLFMVSVGLNVFLLFFDQDNNVAVASLPQNAEISFQSKGEESQPEAAEPENELPKQFPQSFAAATIKPVSFTTSAERTPGGKNIQSLNFKIRNSLNYSVCREITRENGCAALSAHIGRLMAWFMDIKKSMRNGDSLDVVYQQLDGPEQFKILKLSYASKRFGKTFEAYYYDGFDKGNGGYFDKEGNEIAQRIVEAQSPIREYIEITSLPGDFRKGSGGHSGTDFKAEEGTPVYSGFAGKVTRTNWNVRANGYCIEIDHPKLGIKTLYLHLSRVKVKRGQTIKAGQQIAESGNTGRTFAPHLHYEIQNRKNKKRVYSPFTSKYHKSYVRRIPQEHLNAFLKNVSLYNSAIKKS